VSQPDAPVKILIYRSEFLEGLYGKPRGIKHQISYQNTTNQTVIAVQFGLVAFDVWNEFLDRVGGDTLEPIPTGKKQSGQSSNVPTRASHCGHRVAVLDRVSVPGRA
jgi:hypothetical protein